MLQIKSYSSGNALLLLGGKFVLFPWVHPHTCIWAFKAFFQCTEYTICRIGLSIKYCNWAFNEIHKQRSGTVASYV